MLSMGDEEPNVVEDGSRLQVFPAYIFQFVQSLKLIVELKRKPGHLVSMFSFNLANLSQMQDSLVADVGQVVQCTPLRFLQGIKNDSFPESKTLDGHGIYIHRFEGLLEDDGAGDNNVGASGVEALDLLALLHGIGFRQNLDHFSQFGAREDKIA